MTHLFENGRKVKSSTQLESSYVFFKLWVGSNMKLKHKKLIWCNFEIKQL